jgi:hypothetical protein
VVPGTGLELSLKTWLRSVKREILWTPAKKPAILPITTGRFTMRNLIIAVAALTFSASSFASTASANAGHHGGGNHGAVGAAAGAFGSGSSAAGSAGSGQSGNGGSYWSPNLNAAPEDAYQPWPQSQMRAFQKP